MGEGGGGGALRELLAVFDISANTEELEKANKKVEGFKEKLMALVKVGMEAFAVDAVKEFVQSQVEVATELDRTAVRLGLTTAEVERLNLAAGLSGVSNEAMSNGLRFLSRNMGEAISKGGDVAATFQRIGIHLKNADGTTRDASDTFEDLADHFSTMPDAAKKTQLAMELFGRQGAALIPILNKGSAAFKEADEAMKELGGATSEKTIEAAKKIEEQEVKLTTAWGNLKMMLAEHIFPVFNAFITLGTSIVKTLIDIGAHTYALNTALDLLGAVASYKAISGLGTLMKTFGLLKPSILETIAALLEFAAPVIIVAVLYFAFDELYTLMRGGKTIIGETLDALFGLGTAAVLALVLNAAWSDTKRIFQDLAAIISGVVIPVFITLFEALKGVGTMIYDIVTAKWGDMGKDAAAAGKAIVDAWKAGGKEVKDAAGDLVGGPAMKLGFGDGSLQALLKAGVDPAMLLRGQNGAPGKPGKVREPTGVSFGRTGKGGIREPHDMTFEHPHGHTREPVEVAYGRGGGGGTVVHQTVNPTVHVNTADKPAAIREAAGKGISDGMDRSNDKINQTKT